MKVLNLALYRALKQLYGRVKITDRRAPMKWHLGLDNHHKPCVIVTQGGEQYEVNCPFCHDLRGRLAIGHSYLTRPHARLPRLSHNLRCYNEECRQVYSTEFQMKVSAAGGDDPVAALAAAFQSGSVEEPKPIVMRLPNGMVPLHELPADHRACQFLRAKYNGVTPELLGTVYGAGYVAEHDDIYPAAKDRIIFPVYDRGQLAGWQGRAVGAHPKKWFLPPGFQKVLYNGDRVGPLQVPIICEGITTSVAAGRSALAIFGKSLAVARCVELAVKWPTAVLLLDPDAYIPHPRTGVSAVDTLRERLDEAFVAVGKQPVYVFRWDAAVIELARRKVIGKENISVPDAADFGPEVTAFLLNQQVPASHRGLL